MSLALRFNLRSLPIASHLRFTIDHTPPAIRGLPLGPRASTRTMASSTKCEWLVIAPDFEGALHKRLEVRQQHLAGITPEPDFWLMGGAFMGSKPKEGETPDMKGSAMLCLAESKEEVLERLKRDIYVTSGVWDLSKIQIYPFKSAVRKGL